MCHLPDHGILSRMNHPLPPSRYFQLRRRAIEMVDSVSQKTCRYCALPCCERRLCRKAFERFLPVLDLEPKATAIRAAAEDGSETPFLDSNGCLFSILRPTVCLAFYCSEGLEGLLRSQRICVLALGRAFPDAEVTRRRDLEFLDYTIRVCEQVLLQGKPIGERDMQRFFSRIPGLSERLSLCVLA